MDKLTPKSNGKPIPCPKFRISYQAKAEIDAGERRRERLHVQLACNPSVKLSDWVGL